jgi:4-amino-4-deoxy-L-arabinose transferase-like glycosyltransferase
MHGAIARDSAAVRLPRLSREAWLLVAIVVVGAALRLVWIVYAARPLTFPVGGDPFAYVMHADDLAHGRGYVVFLSGRATAFQAPGWPFALAGWYWLANHTPLPDDVWNMAAVLNLLFAVGSMVLLFSIGRRLFDARVGLVAAALFALWPNLVFYTAVAAVEPCFIFVVLAALWLLLRLGWPTARLSWPALTLVGLVVGGVVFVRPFGVAIVVAMIVAGLVAGRGWRRTLIEAGVVTLVAIAVLVPWTVRNAVRLHGFVPVATGLGETACIGHQPDATGGLVTDTKYCVGRFDSAHITTAHLEIERNRYASRQALEFALHHPVDEARLLFWRGYYLFQHDHDGVDAVEPLGPSGPTFVPLRWRAVSKTVADAWFFAVAVLAAFSLPQWFGRRRGNRMLVAVTGFGLLLVPLELFGLPRYKVPLAPFLALGAAVTVLRLTTRSNAEVTAPPRTTPASPG